MWGWNIDLKPIFCDQGTYSIWFLRMRTWIWNYLFAGQMIESGSFPPTLVLLLNAAISVATQAHVCYNFMITINTLAIKFIQTHIHK